MVMEGDLTWGSECIIKCTDEVLQNCTPETYVMLLTNITPINSVKILLRIKTQPPQRGHYNSGRWESEAELSPTGTQGGGRPV